METVSYQGDGTIGGGDSWMVVSFRLTEEQTSFWGYEEGA